MINTYSFFNLVIYKNHYLLVYVNIVDQHRNTNVRIIFLFKIIQIMLNIKLNYNKIWEYFLR